MFFPVSGIECHPLVPVLAAMGISFVTSMGGLSGAFLLLPFQMSFLGYTSPGVSATNHLFNVLACPGGIVRYAREGRLLWPLALTVAVGTLPGIVLGSLIRVYWLPDESRFKVFAGLLLLWIFWRMFRDLRRPAAPARKGGGMARIHVERWDRSRLVFTFGEARHSVSCPRLAALSLGIGLAGGIYGIGGGAILSPFLVSIFGLPVHAIAGRHRRRSPAGPAAGPGRTHGQLSGGALPALRARAPHQVGAGPDPALHVPALSVAGILAARTARPAHRYDAPGQEKCVP